MKRFLKWLFFLLLLGIGVVVFINYPKLDLISGFAAKSMASNVFVAHRTPASVQNQDHNAPLIELADAQVDEATSSATATVYGLKERKAVYREGLGAVLLTGDLDASNPSLVPKRQQPSDSLPFPYGHMGLKDTVFANVDYDQVQKAIDQAFFDPNVQRTRTVLIAYKGQILGERYAKGFSAETPILGWSMTKSILATLYGILEYQGKLDVQAPAPVPEWQQDERKNITLDNLLRMQSGLAWDEQYDKICDVTKMLFLEPDMTKTQRDKKAVAAPGEIWNYSSGTTNMLSGILREQLGSYQEYLNFPYNALLDKIGMYSSLIETDMAGNYVGSSYGWANTRDWARFGILYLNRGNWNGEQLFAPEWVDYISTPTLHSYGTYGAHFWLNSEGLYPDVPKDLFSANGYQGQFVFVIPSKDLVVVRTGLAEAPDFKINAFLKEVLQAIK